MTDSEHDKKEKLLDQTLLEYLEGDIEAVKYARKARRYYQLFTKYDKLLWDKMVELRKKKEREPKDD